jgi:ribonuclease HI
MSTDLIIHTDGASRGNPGAAAYAYVITRTGEPPIEYAARLPDTTNNQAEYTALVEALRKAIELGATGRVRIHSDSELMVKQMRGEYRVKDEGLRELYDEARELAAQLSGGVTYTHVRRAQNKRADELCNLALDGKWQPGEGESPASVDRSAPAREGSALELQDDAVLLLRAALESEPAPAAEEVWRSLVKLLARHGIKVATR